LSARASQVASGAGSESRGPGIAAEMLPGIGLLMVTGLLASVLASAAGDAAVAGVAGALVGLGFSEEAHSTKGQ
jgi:hypothetical protein